MRSFVLLIGTLLSLAAAAQAPGVRMPDTLILKSGSRVPVYIVEFSQDKVKYRRDAENTTGATLYQMPLSNVGQVIDMRTGSRYAPSMTALLGDTLGRPALLTLRSGRALSGQLLSLSSKGVRFFHTSEVGNVYLHYPLHKIMGVRDEEGVVQELPDNPIEDPFQQRPPTLRRRPYQLNLTEAYQRGVYDAHQYYSYKPKALGIFLYSYFAPLPFSPILATVVATTPPKPATFVAEDYTLLDDPNYRMGYQHEAHRKKQRATWTAWGTGFVMQFSTAILVLLLATR
ncbi:MAG: hypothetical protein WBA12_12475 [Catalinimonas sp.]